MFSGHGHSFAPSPVAGFGDLGDMAYDIVPAQDLSGFGDLEIAEDMSGFGELELAVDGFGAPGVGRGMSPRDRRILMRRYRKLKARRSRLRRRLTLAKSRRRRARIRKRLKRVQKMMRRLKGGFRPKWLGRRRRRKFVRRFRPRNFRPMPMPTGTPPMALYRPPQRQYVQAPLPLTQYQPITQPQPAYQTVGQNEQQYVNLNADSGEDFEDEDFNENEFSEDSGENDEMDELGMMHLSGAHEPFGAFGAMAPATSYMPAAAVAAGVYFVTAPSAKSKKARTAALFTSAAIGALFFMATSGKKRAATAGW